MKLDASMHQTLARINVALLNGNEAALSNAFEGVDLQQLLSQDTLAVVRVLGKSPLALLLCTLAVHNGVEPGRAAHWLACYQSVARKTLDASLATLSASHVLRVAVQTLAGIPGSTVRKLKGSAQAWQDAVELALDHKNWALAQELLGQLGHGAAEAETWQRVARCLTRRHPIYVDETGLQQVDVDYPALAHLYDLCAEAAKRNRSDAVGRALKQLAASAMEVAGEYGPALARLQALDPAHRNESIQLDIARCQCKKGDLPASIAVLDRVLALRAERSDGNEEALRALQGSQGGATESRGFNVAKASAALHDMTQIAASKQIPVFLVSGTLLGYVREGQLLAHDKDIDVGIIGWEHQYELCLALQQSALFTVSAQFLKGKDTVYFPVQHNATGMWIDVFVYHPRDDQLVTGVDFFFGYRQTFAFTPFALQDIEFLGVPMHAPADAERNLTENFGPGWRLPDAAYISHLESPSTMNPGDLSYMVTARLTAIAACIKRQPAKLGKVLQLMERYQGQPGSMAPDLIDTLRTRLPVPVQRRSEHTNEALHHA